MCIQGDESLGVVAWLAQYGARPVWHVSRDGRLSALNPIAEALECESVENLAVALVSGELGDRSALGYDFYALGEGHGGGFLMIARSEVDLLTRVLAEARGLWKLSERQVDALRELAEGCNAKEIAARLGIAYHTARDHCRALRDKSGCVSALEVVGKLLKMG